MAQVTVELRTLLNMKDFELFDFEYGINDPVWKEEFEELFKNYYYFYEIGAETADRFKHNLKTRLQTIMPYYNELYETTLMDIDPLLTYKMVEEYLEGTQQETTGTSTDHGEGSSNSNTTETKDDTRTEYPQHSNIQDDIPTERLGQSSTTNTSNIGSSTSTRNETTSVEGEKDYKKTLEGLQGNPNELLRQYRENIININYQLIMECKDLFILVY